MNTELVSVIVPTYQGCNVIKRAVDSVLNQTYPNIEVIVVDDNSPSSQERKDTETAMSKYEGNDKVIYIRHERNKNGAAARNTGIRHAHGQFIAFLDDDDWFLPEKVEKQLQYLLSYHEYAACYCLAQREGKAIPTTAYQGDVTKELLLMKSCMFTPSLFFRKEVFVSLDGFDESFKRHQDYELLLRFFHQGYKMGCVEAVLLELGTGAGNNIPSAENLYELKQIFLERFSYAINNTDQSDPGFKNKTYALHYGRVFEAYVVEHHFVEALRLANKYIWCSPSYFTYSFRRRVSGFIKRRLYGLIGRQR